MENRYIWLITEDLHSNITDIYEELSDGNNEEALSKINQTIDELKELKKSVVIKDN